jgi:amino acid adenylation domain-containing protein
MLELFERQVASRPGSVAVVSGQHRITYQDLDVAASRVAGELTAGGIGRGHVVAVVTGRSEAALVALLSVWRVGAAYLPLDPAHPADRIALVLGDARASAVVTERRFVANVPASDAQVVTVDEAAAAVPSPPLAGATPDDVAYVIYTSGSTGRPKGVAVSHRSLVNVVLELSTVLDCGSDDRWITVAPTTFDISMAELCVPLACGAQLVVAAEAELRDAQALTRLIRSSGVNRMQAVPSQWRMLLDAGFEAPAMVAMVGGEPLSLALATALRSRVRALVNGYGPTETTVVSTYWQVPDAPTRIAIGGPIANTRLYLLDERLDPVDPGQPGELYIGGTGVALGYLGRPELTAQRFLPDPDGPDGARMYRTGDRCRLTPDGVLEYLGRDDDQVKVRGQRIELGEVEARLATHPAVVAVAALVHEDVLVAYVIAAPSAGPAPDPAQLRAYVAQALPTALVPNSIVLRADLPVTANGKVDRSALRDELVGRPAVDAETAPPYPEPGTDPWTLTVCGICHEVLGVHVRPEDDLFELGAHSLTVMQIAARMRVAWEVTVPTDVFYQAATISDLAAAVGELVGRSR